MSKPNLFRYATSELSQDAALCWLLAWAAPEAAAEDPHLGWLGRDLVRAMCARHGAQAPEIRSIRIDRQFKHIDILARINVGATDEIVLVIEDKVFTREHSDQLARYLVVLESEGLPRERIVPIYLKAGEQSDFREVEAAGFRIFSRGDLLDLLARAIDAGCRNEILLDFAAHVQGIDESVNAYRSTPINSWGKGLLWQGFFADLQKEFEKGEWAYVANPSGGFMAFWWRVDAKDQPTPYLQLQDGRLCAKIYVYEKEERSRLWDHWHQRVLAAARSNDFPFTRPRKRTGESMTVAVLDEYRETGHGELLELKPTIERLKRAETVLLEAIAAGG